MEDARRLTKEEIVSITNCFQPDLLIGSTHFGEVFKGHYLSKEVTVKIWGLQGKPRDFMFEETFSRNKSRFEVCLLIVVFTRYVHRRSSFRLCLDWEFQGGNAFV